MELRPYAHWKAKEELLNPFEQTFAVLLSSDEMMPYFTAFSSKIKVRNHLYLKMAQLFIQY